jgi:hypothetical protein
MDLRGSATERVCADSRGGRISFRDGASGEVAQTASACAHHRHGAVDLLII